MGRYDLYVKVHDAEINKAIQKLQSSLKGMRIGEGQKIGIDGRSFRGISNRLDKIQSNTRIIASILGKNSSNGLQGIEKKVQVLQKELVKTTQMQSKTEVTALTNLQKAMLSMGRSTTAMPKGWSKSAIPIKSADFEEDEQKRMTSFDEMSMIKKKAENKKSEKKEEEGNKGLMKITKLLGNIDKKQAALTGISFAVGGIFGVLTDSSQLLQGMLKLINTGVMLILKPIGDFITLVFRPIVVLLYQWVIVPFYKYVYPALTALANMLGKNLESNLVGIFELLTGQGESAGKRVEETNKILTDGFSSISDVWNAFMVSLPSVDFNKGLETLAKFFKTVGSVVSTIMSQSWDKLVKLFVEIGKAVSGFISDNWETLVSFFGGLAWGILGMARNWMKAIAFFMQIKAAIDGILSPAWDAVKGFFAMLLSWADGMKLPNIGEMIMNWWNSLKLPNLGDMIANIFRNVSAPRIRTGGGGGSGGYTDARDRTDNSDSTSTTTETSGGDTGGTDTGSAPEAPKKPKYAPKPPAKRPKPIPKSYSDYEANRHRLAGGGIINEPVFGIGRSGAQYEIGERGPEMVIPMRGSKGKAMGSRSINITINAQVQNMGQVEMIVSRVKQELQKDSRRLGVI